MQTFASSVQGDMQYNQNMSCDSFKFKDHYQFCCVAVSVSKEFIPELLFLIKRKMYTKLQVEPITKVGL